MSGAKASGSLHPGLPHDYDIQHLLPPASTRWPIVYICDEYTADVRSDGTTSGSVRSGAARHELFCVGGAASGDPMPVLGPAAPVVSPLDWLAGTGRRPATTSLATSGANVDQAVSTSSSSSSSSGVDVCIVVGPEGGWSPRERSIITALCNGTGSSTSSGTGTGTGSYPPADQRTSASGNGEIPLNSNEATGTRSTAALSSAPGGTPVPVPVARRLCLSRSSILRAETAAMMACAYVQMAAENGGGIFASASASDASVSADDHIW